MSTTVINMLALIIAVILGWIFVMEYDTGHRVIAIPSTESQSVYADDMRDARGTALPRKRYERIASVAIQADALLVELCEPQRLVGVSAWSTGAWTHRLGTVPRLQGLDDMESILALRPDVVLVSSDGSTAETVARLRHQGVVVCDLGTPGGLESLARSAHILGELLGERARADQLMTTLRKRLALVAARVPENRRKTALYVQCVGDQLYGGASGTSFHDVLASAGLVDVAATSFNGWPHYTTEQLLSWNPDVLVTQPSGVDQLRRLPGITALRAAHDPHGIVALDSDLLQCPGPIMLDAAEALYAAVYRQ